MWSVTVANWDWASLSKRVQVMSKYSRHAD